MAEERMDGDPGRLRGSATASRLRRPSTGSGAVPLGEASVIVAVSAAHREEAFAGAREAIDRIKADGPIWKREVEAHRRTASTGRWVEGTPG